MDQTKIVKMLRLMKMMTGNTNFTIGELADKLGTTERTIYRYIDSMRDAGFVVNKVYGNVYQMGKMSRQLPNLKKFIYFTEEEAYILSGMLENLSATNSLKADLKRKLLSVYDCTSIAQYSERANNAPNIEALVTARDEKLKVILKNYESGNGNVTRDRVVEPFDFTAEMIDVWAWDTEKQENRVFKVARIDEVQVTEEPWENEAQHSRSDTDIFRMSGELTIPVKLQLKTRAKALLLEEYPMATKYLTKDGKDWILETKVARLEGVGRFTIGLADDVKILEGEELKTYVREFVQKYLV